MHRMGPLLYHYVSPLTNYAIQSERGDRIRQEDDLRDWRGRERGGQAEEVQWAGFCYCREKSNTLYTRLNILLIT